MTTDKKQVRILLDILKQRGVENFVISPGSRNTPIIIGVARDNHFTSQVVIDERSAAFVALGLSAQIGKPVALVCTSGTAVLNYAPAIAEAYYRNIPLVVITADREPEVIDQNDSQTIRQNNVYANYIKYSCTLPTEIKDRADEIEIIQLVDKAISKALTPDFGPVHINVPLREPLAGLSPVESLNIELPKQIPLQKTISRDEQQELIDKLSKYKKVMLLASFAEPDAELDNALAKLVELPQVVLLTETISNINVGGAITTIDRTLTQLTEDNRADAAPELLITFGGSLVSKMVKTLLRTHKPKEHIHISECSWTIDTFSALTWQIDMSASSLFSLISDKVLPNDSAYNKMWHDLAQAAADKKREYVASVGWSDMKAFSLILPSIPADTYLQLSNGTPIRYAQLFDNYSCLKSTSNRGVSGIDGSTSTAIGAAFGTENMVLLITGDMGFQYDSNALSIADIPSNLKIIVMK
ncbi:MAG: 2-succinyl-5-enolpyruvyl-6-hydroxy-3-cyclohexene-1-carboxylic-acid synthase, partial [Muribaculaceae bacterium]|nr:2-succinyl-5-enolpyruvyl-6-hydroxy-3-cyclohexene-1-carboxylic-acid synthase [Muribaculaceae bacterium]